MSDNDLPDGSDDKFNLGTYLMGVAESEPSAQPKPTKADTILQSTANLAADGFSFLSKEISKGASGFLNLWSHNVLFSLGITAGLFLLITFLILNSGSGKPLHSNKLPPPKLPTVNNQLQSLEINVQRAGSLLTEAGVTPDRIQSVQRSITLARGTQIVSNARLTSPSALTPEDPAHHPYKATSVYSPTHYQSVQDVSANQYVESLAPRDVLDASVANSSVIHAGTSNR